MPNIIRLPFLALAVLQVSCINLFCAAFSTRVRFDSAFAGASGLQKVLRERHVSLSVEAKRRHEAERSVAEEAPRREVN